MIDEQKQTQNATSQFGVLYLVLLSALKSFNSGGSCNWLHRRSRWSIWHLQSKPTDCLLSRISSRSPRWSFTATRTLSWESRHSGTSAICPITEWWWWRARDTRVTWTTRTRGTELSRTSCARCESFTTNVFHLIWKARRMIMTPWRQIHIYFILMT